MIAIDRHLPNHPNPNPNQRSRKKKWRNRNPYPNSNPKMNTFQQKSLTLTLVRFHQVCADRFVGQTYPILTLMYSTLVKSTDAQNPNPNPNPNDAQKIVLTLTLTLTINPSSIPRSTLKKSF